MKRTRCPLCNKILKLQKEPHAPGFKSWSCRHDDGLVFTKPKHGGAFFTLGGVDSDRFWSKIQARLLNNFTYDGKIHRKCTIYIENGKPILVFRKGHDSEATIAANLKMLSVFS